MSERDGTRVSPELAAWHDRMYQLHGTPYDRGLTRVIQEARAATVLRLADVSPEDSVLEVGCESGQLLSRVPPCRRLVGLDISEAALADARGLFAAAGRAIELRQHDAEQPLPIEPGEFDVVICSEMLEHSSVPRTVLENIHAAIGDRTRVVLTVPLERPKLVVKAILHRLGLLGLLFPGIEPGQSEWHLQAFSRAMLHDMTEDLFRIEARKVVWGCHYATRVIRR